MHGIEEGQDSTMPKIAICEDDARESRAVLELVRAYGESHPNTLEDICLFPSSAALLEAIERGSGFDLYLLDIMMPGLSGIDAAKRLRSRGKGGSIIFLTSSRDYALEAYRVGALQYLLKPVDRAELFDALDGALELVRSRESKSILVSTVRGRENLRLSNIAYVECRNHILTYHLSDGIALLGRTIRTSFEVAMEPLLLEDNFIHPHKSFIINADYVERLTAQMFVMSDGTEIPITKSRCTQARSKYLRYFDLQPGL